MCAHKFVCMLRSQGSISRSCRGKGTGNQYLGFKQREGQLERIKAAREIKETDRGTGVYMRKGVREGALIRKVSISLIFSYLSSFCKLHGQPLLSVVN